MIRFRKPLVLSLTGILTVVLSSFWWDEDCIKSGLDTSDEWSDETPLIEVLMVLGEEPAPSWLEDIDTVKVRIGHQLVYRGKATLTDGKDSKRISRHFVCTNCHNQQREDPNLSQPNPEDRLAYVEEHGLPFLQGTTFYGLVNRSSYFNDDYQKKYGRLAEEAKQDLAAATQLCATECSSGRLLEAWELEAIMHYYWSLQLKMGDLQLNEKEWRKVRMLSAGEMSRHEVVALLKSKYSPTSHAHFTDGPGDLEGGYPDVNPGRADQGEKIFRLSCQSCHSKQGASMLVLNSNLRTFKRLSKHFTRDTRLNGYKLVRHGTRPNFFFHRYMPLYPLERMSNQQVEDLKAYIWAEANNK